MTAPNNLPPAGSPQDWLRHAASDVRLARIGLADLDVLRNQIAFHAQQAAEKAIKAVLLQRGVVFPRTHDLETLQEIVQLAGISWPFPPQQIEALNPYAVETRYPSGFAQITTAEAEAAIQSAEAVLTWAQPLVP